MKLVVEAEKGLIVNQQDLNLFGCGYNDDITALSSMNAFLRETDTLGP